MKELGKIPRPKRIDIKVKTIPFSLRKFIGNIMNDEEKFNAFAESPIVALVKADVPIDAAKFTREDAEHLVLVMGKIHAYVQLNKSSEDLKFEDIFNIESLRIGKIAYAFTESFSYTWENITPDTRTYTRKHRGVSPTFERDGLNLEMRENILTSPLISPKEFSAVLTPLEAAMDAELGIK